MFGEAEGLGEALEEGEGDGVIDGEGLGDARAQIRSPDTPDGSGVA